MRPLPCSRRAANAAARAAGAVPAHQRAPRCARSAGIACDVIIVTGDAYVDHPSFGMAIIGRVLEAHGFKVGIIAQPDWRSTEDFARLGAPRLFFGVTGGNMDSMVNRYTADRRVRSDDAYTPGARAGRRPDRCVIVYSQRMREAFKSVPIVIGGIEASLRRIAHFDYWSDQVRRSVLVDAQADLLVYGNAERQIARARSAARRGRAARRDHGFARHGVPAPRRAGRAGSRSIRPSSIRPARSHRPPIPTPRRRRGAPRSRAAVRSDAQPEPGPRHEVVRFFRKVPNAQRERSVIRMPSFEQVSEDAVLYAHASRILHLESNPGNARALVQRHGSVEVWLNPPPIPLGTADMDAIYELPYARRPHPAYGNARIPAYHMIRFSVAIQRGCFGGCTFCSITEHEGRIIQSRSEDSVIREIETIRDTVPGFTGVISDLGGPTANMYRLHCKSAAIESACRRPSCVYPGVCPNLNTDHAPLISLYRRARGAQGREEGVDRLGRALRPRGRVARVRQGARGPSHRRLSEDRARGDRRGPAVEDDEARRRRLLQVQGAVRQVLEGGGQGAVPHSVFHRRAPRHDAMRTCSSSRCGSRRTAFAPIRCRRSCPRRWRRRPPCTTRARIR